MDIKSLSISSAALSDRGKHRTANEDSWVCNTQLGLYAVADGMGGHGSGDVASKLTVETVENIIAQSAQATISNSANATTLVQSAIQQANSAVFAENIESYQQPGNGMGTTLVGAYLPTAENYAPTNTGIMFNIGDSRLYRYRENQLTQLTEDHTLLRQWQLGKKLEPAPPGNIIMRAVGLFENVECDITPITLISGDLILICSDGLSDMLSDTELTRVLSRDGTVTAQTLCDELIRLANRNGGIDNITAIALLVE